MNNIQSVGTLALKNQPIPEVETKQNIRKINFKADNDQFVRQGRPRGPVYTQPAILQQAQQPQQDPYIRMLEKQQKEEKKKNFWNKFALFAGIAASLAIVAALFMNRNAGAVSSEVKKAMETCKNPALKKAAMEEYAKGPHMRSEKKIRDILALAEASSMKPGMADLEKAAKLMDEKLVDMHEVKEQIMSFLVEYNYNIRNGIKNKKPLVIVMDGPAGTGKTTASEVIAEALGIPYKKVSMGGATGTSIIKGTESKFVGAEAGGIAKGQIDNKTNRVLYCLDEVDKLGKSEQHGSTEAALLSLFDDQAKFADDFLGAELDISNSIFVLTTNDYNKLSTPLKNRMKLIKINPYGLETKTKIAKMHLTKELNENKLFDKVSIKEDSYEQLAKMTDDEGGRQTTKNVQELIRQIKTKLELGEVSGANIEVDSKFIKKHLTFDPNAKTMRERVSEAVSEGRMQKPVEEVLETATSTATV